MQMYKTKLGFVTTLIKTCCLLMATQHPKLDTNLHWTLSNISEVNERIYVWILISNVSIFSSLLKWMLVVK